MGFLLISWLLFFSIDHAHSEENGAQVALSSALNTATTEVLQAVVASDSVTVAIQVADSAVVVSNAAVSLAVVAVESAVVSVAAIPNLSAVVETATITRKLARLV